MAGTIIVSIVLIIVLVVVISSMVKSKKKGKNILGCGGNCSACGISCPKRNDNTNENK